MEVLTVRNNYVSSKVKLIKGNCGEGTYLIPYIKKTFGHENYYDILNTLRSNINYKDYFLKELFPVDVNNIITTDYIPLSFSPNEISGEFVVNEILCFLSFFRCFQKELNEFVNLRKDYEHHLFSGNYDLANKILLEIKETFGVSFWLLESQLLVANFSLSIVQAESFYQNLKSECNDYFIKSYVRSLRRKTNTFESAKDSLYFLDKKEKDFLAFDKKVSFEKQVYFSFNNHYYERIPDEKIWALLNMATKLNFIDMFILIERIIVYLLTDNNFSKTQLNKIVFAVSDYDLPLCCKKSCDQINNKIDWKDSITKIIYEYKKQLCSITKNDFKFVNSDKFCELPSSFDAVFYSTLIDVLMSRECECSSLLRLVVNVIKASVIKKGDYHEFNKITNDSLRLQMLLNSTSMFWGYVDIYNQFFLGDVSYHTKHVIASCYYNREILLCFNMDNVLKQFNDNFGNHECNWFHNIELDGRMTYDSVTEKMCTIEHEKEALAEWHGLLSNHGSIISDILYNRCSEMLFLSYLRSNSINKAIDLFVDLQFESKFKVGSFDNDLLIQKCNGIRLNGLYTNINFCIYAHLTNFRGASGLRLIFHLNYLIMKKLIKRN